MDNIVEIKIKMVILFSTLSAAGQRTLLLNRSVLDYTVPMNVNEMSMI